MARETLSARLRRIAPPTPGGCWLWTGQLSSTGYGKVQVNGRTRVAHRVAYEEFTGPIPEGLQLDHVCRNRACINPDHLEPVTAKTNTNRGRRANNEKTHCPAGHPYDETNTYQRPYRNGKPGRSCRTCHNTAERDRKARRRAKERA